MSSASSVSDQSITDARQRLRDAKAWLFDMDGVLYRGNTALPGVGDLFNALSLRGIPYVLATNNSTATQMNYVEKLASMGIDVPLESISTSAMATRDYLKETLVPDAGVLVIGSPALREQIFTGTFFRPIQFEEEIPAAVVCGLDTQFTYDKLRAASMAIRAGARFIATNADATLPTEVGLMPGCGTIVRAIETASGVTPIIIGKPEPLLLTEALHRLGVPASQAVMIGDRLDTDIVAGARAGTLTALVLTGVSTRDEVATYAVKPDLIFNDLPSMLEAII